MVFSSRVDNLGLNEQANENVFTAKIAFNGYI